MDRRETVIESIQKLLALSVSDAEISENLYDVGIEKAEALSLIAEAKRKNSASKEPLQTPLENPVVSAPMQNSSAQGGVTGKSSEDYFEETVSDLSMNDQIIRQIPINKKESSDTEDNQNLPPQAQQPSEDIADKIMADVANQDKEEDIEDAVNGELSSVGKTQEENAPVQSIEDVISNQPSESVPQIPKAPNVQTTKTQIAQNPKMPPTQVSKSTPQPVQQASQVIKTPPAQASQVSPQSRKQAFESVKSFSSIPTNFASPQSFSASQNYSAGTKNFVDSTPDFEALWKKGIVVAVNSKLAEMKHLKDDVDDLVAQKVDEAVRKELYQYKVLLDSQKDLMISSNNEALGQKQKEIVFIIDSKIAELKQYNKQLSDTLTAIESAKKQQELALSQISMALEDAKRTKMQMIVELNSEMIKSKSQAQEFIDQSSAHLAQMDERINKTLELEKNIAEGMLAAAEQKIETLTIQRADELIEKLEVELNRLQSASKKISPEMLDQKIAVLDEFKKQFLTSMQQSLAQINTAVEELNQKNILAERTLQEKTLAIDAKLEELTKFEKEFTQGLDKLLK